VCSSDRGHQKIGQKKNGIEESGAEKLAEKKERKKNLQYYIRN